MFPGSLVTARARRAASDNAESVLRHFKDLFAEVVELPARKRPLLFFF